MLQSLRTKLLAAGHAEAADEATGLDGGGLLEAIVCETQTAALHVAAVASGVNALRARVKLESVSALGNLLPGDSAVIGELLRAREEAGLSAPASQTVRDFFGDLSAARTGMERFLADAEREGMDHANATHSATLAHWSQICGRAVASVRALASGASDRLPQYYADNSAMLLQLLEDCDTGQHPCHSASGQIQLPDLPQRRRTTRRSLLQQCVLRHRGKTSQVIAKDISTTGIGLERVPELKPQELVQIELNGGRRLMGAVIWVKGTTAGIKLGRPLPPNDPLLVG